MSLDDIRTMIGDDQKFVDRIVEGYYFVEEALSKNAYDPADSLRKGRGSFHEFPFSWVYTALGYRSVRRFLGFPPENIVTPEPIPDDSLENAGKILGYLFGASGRNASIGDSRQIGTLAKAIASEDGIAALDKGESAEDALEELRPPEERFKEMLRRADSTIEKCVAVASGFSNMERDILHELQEKADNLALRVDLLAEVLSKVAVTRRARRTQSRGRRS